MNITNVCINLGHWLLHFKTLTTIVIPKPNKELYNTPKAYQSIVLLNIISKLFEKVIGKRMQFLIISNNFIYLCQLGGLKQRSTLDAGIALIYSIHIEWVKHCTTSILAFYIAQFFPLLNHQVLSLVLDKASFDPKVLIFFQNYLVDRKIKYLWNSFFFLFSMLTLE